MKKRFRKKYYNVDCSHYFFDRFCVTDDPYPMYMTEEYCKVKDMDIDNLCEHCQNCKHYSPDKNKLRERRVMIKVTKHMSHKEKEEMFLFLPI